MNDLDLKLKLFGGLPIHAEGYGDIRPLTVKDVISYGYSNYMKKLNVLMLEKEDFFKEDANKIDKEITILDILIALGGEDLNKELEDALTLFLGSEAVIDRDNLRVLINKSEKNVLVVDRHNYDSIREVLKWQNYINHFEDKKIDDFNPADEEARKLKEQMDKLKKQRDEIKRKQSGEDEEDRDIDFYDIISAISSKANSLNEIEVMSLTVYQVYRNFKRLEIIDQYEISIKSIMAGAQDVKLQHWSSKEK